jgi:gas vesicle protein
MYEAILAAVGSLVGAAVAGLVALLAFLRKGKKQDERTAVGYYRAIIEQQQEQLRLHNAQMADAMKALGMQRDLVADCEVDKEALFGVAERQHDDAVRGHDCCCRTFAILRKLGHDPGDDPPPPRPLPERRRRAEAKRQAEFVAREAEQGARALTELDRKKGETPGP